MSLYLLWAVSGSYYEVCNCEAICPCRRHGARKGGALPSVPVISPSRGASIRATQVTSISRISQLCWLEVIATTNRVLRGAWSSMWMKGALRSSNRH